MENLLRKPVAEGVQQANGGPSPDQGIQTAEEGATQEDYDRGVAAVTRAIHGKAQKSILKKLDPKNPVGTIADVAAMAIYMADESEDLHEEVIINLADEAVDLLIEMGQETNRIRKMSPKKVQQAVATTIEALYDYFGVDEAEHSKLAQELGDEGMSQATANYEALLEDG
jgi:hypothetical protein